MLAVSVLRELKPDLVHLNGLDGAPIVAAAQLLVVPIIVHVRNGAFSIYEEYLRSASCVIAVSHFLKRGVEALVPKTSPVEVIYDEVDPEYLRPSIYECDKARAALGLPRDGFVAACIARIAPNKRHDLLSTAASFAREEVSDLHLLFIGGVFENPFVFHAVQDQIERTGFRDRVTWISVLREHPSYSLRAAISPAADRVYGQPLVSSN